MGVYAWIRENVKRAVLMGFNDAIEQIGPPTEEKPLNEHLSAVLNKAPALTGPVPTTAAAAIAVTTSEVTQAAQAAFESQPMGARPRRKRLGRSLEQIQGAPTKAA